MEEKRPWSPRVRGRGAVCQTGRLEELLEEQAEEVVQRGRVFFITEGTVKKVNQTERKAWLRNHQILDGHKKKPASLTRLKSRT